MENLWLLPIGIGFGWLCSGHFFRRRMVRELKELNESVRCYRRSMNDLLAKANKKTDEALAMLKQRE